MSTWSPSDGSIRAPMFARLRGTAAARTLVPFDLAGVRGDLERARLELELGHVGEAEATLTQIVGALPLRAQSDSGAALLRASALATIGESRANAGDAERASRHFSEALELFRQFEEELDARQRGDYGMVLRRLGRARDAIDVLRRALAEGDL